MIDSGDIPQTITNDSIQRLIQQMNFSEVGYSQGEEGPNLWAMLFLLVPIIIGLYFLFFSTTRMWQKGIFPKRLAYNQVNLFDAYVVLGIHMMKKDISDYKEQTTYFRSYLKNRFANDMDYSLENLRNMLKLDVSLESTLAWLQKKMPEAERVQVIDFLADLAFYDHQAHPREIAMINHVADILEVDRQQVTAILSIRFQRYEKQQSRKTPVRDNVRIQDSLQILGLEKVVSFEEIKQAYRKMVRRFHPDRFARMSKEEQEMAHERFTEINLAYEYLEGRFN